MFSDTLLRWLESIAALKDRWALNQLLTPLFDRQTSRPLSTFGLVIKAGGSTLAKTGAADAYYIANGVLNKVTAATDMPALTGISISANNYNVVCFVADSAGTITALAGKQATTIGAVVFPQLPQKKALIGFLLITNGASAFTGGTTALDTATTVYFSPTSGFDPACLTGL